MKKIRNIALALLVCALLAGCDTNTVDSDTTATDSSVETDIIFEEQETPYIALVMDHTSVLANDEYDEKDTESFTAKPKETIDTVINGKTVKGTYIETFYNDMEYYPNYRYRTEDSSTYFSINHRGILTECVWSTPAPAEDAVALTRDECVTKATDFVKSVMSEQKDFDINDYRLSVEVNTKASTYFVRFTKYIDSYMTLDYALVSVSFYGELQNYNSSFFGMIDADSEVEFDEPQVRIAIVNKLNSIYENNDKGYTDIKYSISDSMSVILLKNNTLALHCSATIEYTDTNSALNAVIVENIRFIVQ